MTEYVCDWFYTRGLQNGNPLEQYAKLAEEIRELLLAQEQFNNEDIKDAIGDIIIVMIGLCLQVNMVFDDVIRSVGIVGHNSLILSYTTLGDGIINKDKDLIVKGIRGIYKYLKVKYGKQFDIMLCVYLAYEQIKNRKGKYIEGRGWVKDERLGE